MSELEKKRKIMIPVFCVLIIAVHSVTGQDLLRRQQHPAQQTAAEQNALNSLANIQLPPQLAALTPQQLHQLAQLREMQLQQEANAKQRETAAAPAPIGLEMAQQQTNRAEPTAQPSTATTTATSGGSQINQPTNGANADKYDDSNGAYNESGSELEGVTMSAVEEQNGGESSATTGGANTSAAPTFEVNWNKCPQLEPSESEKTKKTQVITKCLQSAPIPTNLTRENVEAHREQIATCALKVEGWFDESGAYKYEKAEAEIRGKKLDGPIEVQVLKFHIACKDEANKKFPKEQNKLIDQVQFYQACMDYYISIVCEIEVSVDQ